MEKDTASRDITEEGGTKNKCILREDLRSKVEELLLTQFPKEDTHRSSDQNAILRENYRSKFEEFLLQLSKDDTLLVDQSSNREIIEIIHAQARRPEGYTSDDDLSQSVTDMFDTCKSSLLGDER